MIKNILFIIFFLLSNNSFSFEFSSKEPLKGTDAFKTTIKNNKDGLYVFFDVQNGYYIYKNKITILVNDNEVLFEKSKGMIKNDSFFGETEIYPFNFYVKLEKLNNVNLLVKHQGCSSEFNLCYMPITDEFKIN